MCTKFTFALTTKISCPTNYRTMPWPSVLRFGEGGGDEWFLKSTVETQFD
jgi:hypothetical protein